MTVSDHVEVATEHPWGIRGWNNSFKLIQESNSQLRRSGCIHVGNEKRKVGKSGHKVNRDSIGGVGGAQTGELIIRPRS
jgi:hypothetical protein